MLVTHRDPTVKQAPRLVRNPVTCLLKSKLSTPKPLLMRLLLSFISMLMHIPSTESQAALRRWSSHKLQPNTEGGWIIPPPPTRCFLPASRRGALTARETRWQRREARGERGAAPWARTAHTGISPEHPWASSASSQSLLELSIIPQHPWTSSQSVPEHPWAEHHPRASLSWTSS